MEKKLRIAYITNIILGGLIFIGALIFMLLHQTVSSYIVKTIPSVLFVVLGIFNLLYFIKSKNMMGVNKRYSILLVIGLFFAMLGDILLIDFFEVGAILFAIGHIFYFVSFCALAKITLRDILISLLIFGLCLLFILLYPFFDFQGMIFLIIIYAFIISFMLGKAISNFTKTKKSILSLVVLMGASLFFFSDFMLLLYKFGHRIKLLDWLCVMTYYPAEFLLASTIFVLMISKKE